MEYIEQLLVIRLKKGDVEAYRYVFEHHYAVLCRYAMMIVTDRFVAENIVGDVMYRLWEKRSDIEIHTSIRAYLIKSVRNQCLDYLKSLRVKSEVWLSDLICFDRYASSGSYEPFTVLVEKELEEIVAESIRQLPQECKTVFLKSRVEGKKYQEIAVELGISVNTVKYHIKNALSILKKSLGGYFDMFLIIFTVSLPLN